VRKKPPAFNRGFLDHLGQRGDGAADFTLVTHLAVAAFLRNGDNDKKGCFQGLIRKAVENTAPWSARIVDEG
jgi:hypothetical protein